MSQAKSRRVEQTVTAMGSGWAEELVVKLDSYQRNTGRRKSSWKRGSGPAIRYELSKRGFESGTAERGNTWTSGQSLRDHPFL